MVAKIATLTDKFAYTYLDPAKWDFIGAPPVVEGSRVKLEQGVGMESKAQYDFTNSQAYAQINAVGEKVNFSFSFRAVSGDVISMALHDDVIVMSLRGQNSNTSTSEQVTYDAVTMPFWRMRDRSHTLYWETSQDGSNWTIQRTQIHTLDLTRGNLKLLNALGDGFGYGPVDLGFGYGPFGGVSATKALPSKVVGGYFAKYKSTDDQGVTRDMTFQEIDPRYGLVYLFQAGPVDADKANYPRGTGAVNLTTEGGGSYFTPAEWKDGVKFLRKRGTTVLLTMGGGGAYVDLSNRTKTNIFIDSVKSIYKAVGGFDGVDFNLETSFAYIRGGSGVPDTGAPSISVSSDQLTITDTPLATRTNYNGDLIPLKDNELASTDFVYQLKITTGSGAGQYRNIVANTATTITVDTPFSPAIDSTSLYEIGIPIFPGEVVYAAQQFRKLWGANFAISIPAAGSFVGPFIQHDLDLVDALYNGVDAKGKKLLDFLAPQFYDLWYDSPTTTNAARASYVVATIQQWAARVGNDWNRIGIGYLTNGPAGSAMSPEAARISYLLTQVDHPTIRGAFHFDIQGDHRTSSPSGPRDQWEWINDLEPIIEATSIGEGDVHPIAGTTSSFDSATGWTLTNGATISGGSLHLPHGDYGTIPTATLNGTYDLNDGYIQIELLGKPLGNASGNLLDFGWSTDSDNYAFVRIFQNDEGGLIGYELHSKTTGLGERIAYYPFPFTMSNKYIRIRKLFEYLFVSVQSSTTGKMLTVGFEDLGVLPPLSGMNVFIRSNGLSTSGEWTIGSFN